MVEKSIVWENPETPVYPSDYVFVDGKRYVRPYFFEFIAHVKQRWSGKTIVDVFSDEFRQRPHSYYVDAVESGRILVDDQKVKTNYTVSVTQKLSHFVHRHEPPVIADSLRILENGADYLTVYKPPSVPVHTCGQYRKNTVICILEVEHNTGALFPIHRLDRLVSGLLIFAKTAAKADQFRRDIEFGLVRKRYVAKVNGVFPAEPVVVDAAVDYDAREGISRVGSSKGKKATTKFSRLSTDGTHSIVQCEPLTGRTHQIRVHLQHLGHPITNDALYLQPNPPNRSKKGRSADLAARSVTPAASQAKLESSSVFEVDALCTNCPNLGPAGYEEDPSDGLWLHCVEYSSDEWAHSCPLPSWAT